MKKFFNSRGFAENTLLFLILGLTSLTIPAISKTLPTYTNQIAQVVNNSPTTQIAEGGSKENGEKCYGLDSLCKDGVCGGADRNGNPVCAMEKSIESGNFCTKSSACKSGSCGKNGSLMICKLVSIIETCGNKICTSNETCVGSPNSDANGLYCVPKTGPLNSYCGKPAGGGPNNDACGSNYCNPSTLKCDTLVNCGSQACAPSQTCIGTSGNDSQGTLCIQPNSGTLGYYCGKPAGGGPNNSACASPYYCDSSTLKCAAKPAGVVPPTEDDDTPPPPAALPLPNPPSNTKAIVYCNNGRIDVDITFTPSNNAANHKVSYSFVNNPLTNRLNPVNNALTVTNVSKNFKFNFTSLACNSAGNCIEDQGGFFSKDIGDPCNPAVGGSNGGSNAGSNGGTNAGKTGDSPLNPPVESNQCIGPDGKVDTAEYLEPRCGGQKFDGTKATVNNTVYCGKQYTDVYTCGGKEYTNDADIDACSKSPWCPTNSNTGGITPVVTSGASSGQGTLNAVVRVVPNGVTYNEVNLFYRKPDGTLAGSIQNKNGSNIYNFSVPVQTGTFNISASVFRGDDMIKNSAETCRNTGGTAPFDCKITVTAGGTVTQNFTMTLDPEATGDINATLAPEATVKPGPSTGTGETCATSGTICGGNNSNACYAAKDGTSLHCCRFTERFCEALGRCVNAGTTEFENCGRTFSSPTPTTVGAFDPSTCNGAPGSATNHCSSKNAAGQTLSCCPGYVANNPSSSTCACVKTSASTQSSQSVASASECSKNSECKALNKNICVLNAQDIGTCK